MRVIDEDVWFDWEYGRVGLQWMIKLDDWKQAWAKVRVHDDGPGPGEWHCNADVWVRDGVFQQVGFISKQEGSPAKSEHRALKDYCSISLFEYVEYSSRNFIH